MNLDREAREALRSELREFQTSAVKSFILAVQRIVALYDLAPQPTKRSERRKELERLKDVTEAYLDQLAPDLEQLNPSKQRQTMSLSDPSAMEAHKRSLGLMIKVIEEADGDLERARQISQARRAAEHPEVDEALRVGDLKAAVEAMRRATPPMPPLLAAFSGVCDAIGLLLEELKQELEKPIPIESGRPVANADGLLTEVASAYERFLHKKPTSTKNGTFYNIAVIVTGQEAPDRGVQAAIREIVNPQNPPPK